MAESVSSAVSRRRFLDAVAVAAAPIAFLARVKTSSGQGQGTVELDPTPAAGEKLVLTPEETAGPFFKPNSPLKNDFRDSGVTGTSVKLTGFVLDRKGRPIPNRWQVRVRNHHARFISGANTALSCSAPGGAWSDPFDSALLSGRGPQFDRFFVQARVAAQDTRNERRPSRDFQLRSGNDLN
jgi:hypothetical protein